jgi:hypothetical protein
MARHSTASCPLNHVRRRAFRAWVFSPRLEQQRMPRGQTSTSEVPGTDQSHGHDGYTGRHRPSASSSRHECGQCVRPKDEKGIGLPASRSYGRSLASLYNGRCPHSSLDGRTPDQAYFNPLPLRRAAQPRQTFHLTERIFCADNRDHLTPCSTIGSKKGTPTLSRRVR